MERFNLTAKEKAALELRHKQCRDAKESDRIKVILLRSEDWTIPNFLNIKEAKMFNVYNRISKKTVDEKVRPSFEIPFAKSYGALVYRGPGFANDKEIEAYATKFFSGEMDKDVSSSVSVFSNFKDAEYHLFQRHGPGIRLRYVFCFNEDVNKMQEILDDGKGFDAAVAAGFDFAQHWRHNKI